MSTHERLIAVGYIRQKQRLTILMKMICSFKVLQLFGQFRVAESSNLNVF